MSRYRQSIQFCLGLLLGAVLPTAAPAADYVPRSRGAIHLSFAPVVKRVAPAVVNFYSRRVIHSRFGPGTLLDDPLFQRFFGDMAPPGMPRERIQNSLGSGVIVDPSGLIVTNRQVIEGADEVNDKDIVTVATLQREVRSPEPWHLTIRRHGQRLAFAVGG